MTNEKDTERSNEKSNSEQQHQPVEPEEVPPSYVKPIDIPIRRSASSTKDNDFSDHPGPRGKPAETRKAEEARQDDSAGSQDSGWTKTGQGSNTADLKDIWVEFECE